MPARADGRPVLGLDERAADGPLATDAEREFAAVSAGQRIVGV